MNYYESQQYDYTMLFADPEYTTPANPDCLAIAEYRQNLRFGMTGEHLFANGTDSWPGCASETVRPNRLWIDVPFWFAWACTALDVGAGAVLITGLLLALNFPPVAVWLSFGLTVFFGSLLLTVLFRHRHRRQA